MLAHLNQYADDHAHARVCMICQSSIWATCFSTGREMEWVKWAVKVGDLDNVPDTDLMAFKPINLPRKERLN